jgi:hypothetical protein
MEVRKQDCIISSRRMPEYEEEMNTNFIMDLIFVSPTRVAEIRAGC